MSLETVSKPWETVDVSAHSWAPPATSNAPASQAENHAKDTARRRMESVFAHSPFQPQQMQQGGASNRASDGRNLAPGYLPSAYQSLPSDASGSMSWSIPSFQFLPNTNQSNNAAVGNVYPSIDHTAHAASPSRYDYVDQNAQDSSQAFPQPVGSGIFLPPAASNGFTIQCGRLSAPTQREAVESSPAFPPLPLPGKSSNGHADKLRKLERQPSFANPLQLQEYYTAQSDILEGLMRNNRAMQQHIQHTNNLVSQGGDLDSEFLDLLGLMSNHAPMQRANSALESIPQPQALSNYPPLEPYMPQWSSESVPAELPGHVVNRLRMNGQAFMGNLMDRSNLRRPDPVSGVSPMQGLLQNHQSLGLGDSRKSHRAVPESPDVNDLEELARTADAEVAHRAFLVPAHKKRGKGGRQPAQDPRLDPSIDERKAKRILANRLSAARSKMKQKNQMDGFGKMVSQLESYKKSVQDDAAELMELCEKLEFQNRRLIKDQKILEEYLMRSDRTHSEARHMQAPHAPHPPQGMEMFQ